MNKLKKFEEYLVSNKKLNESSVKKYFKVIEELFVYIDDSFIDTIEKIDRIYENVKNSEKDKKGNGMYSSAINHYKDFLISNKSFKDFNEEINVLQKHDIKVNKPHQQIFFGAPGTGKSYKLNEEAESNFFGRYERVTFHPNYMYGQFVGTFKPFPKMIEDKETITYDYIPGVLLKTLVKAIKSDEPQLLIIEEINRANTAAVFGDFFQLLDRDSSGESEYKITASEDVKLYLEKVFLDKHNNIKEEDKERVIRYLGEDFSFIKFPANLYIWATMNSADQGVMPLDTAFKRRWDFKYIGIDEATQKENWREHYFKVIKNSKDSKGTEYTEISWNDFRKAINNSLSSSNIPEDKLLGPYFITKSILEKGEEKIKKAIKNKVLMYLYEDVLRSNRTKLFKPDYSKTYSSLCKGFYEVGLNIFNDNVDFTDSTSLKYDISNASFKSEKEVAEVKAIFNEE